MQRRMLFLITSLTLLGATVGCLYPERDHRREQRPEQRHDRDHDEHRDRDHDEKRGQMPLSGLSH
jgi:hypothetical protein